MKKSSTKSFRNYLDEQYGKQGSQSRQAYESGFEAFRLGAMLQDLRKEPGDELS